MQVQWRHDAKQMNIIVDDVARLQWRLTDYQIMTFDRVRRAFVRNALAKEPEYVKQFVRRWLPRLAQAQGWAA